MELLRHCERCRVVFFTDDDRSRHSEGRKERTQVGITEQNAACGIAIDIVRQKHTRRCIHYVRMCGAERIAKPARDLKINETGQAFGSRSGGARAPYLRRVLS